MTKTTVGDVRQSMLGTIGKHDPARPALEAITATDAGVRDVLDPAEIDADRARFADRAAAHREELRARTDALRAAQPEEAILDAWAADSAAHSESRRRWAHGDGREAVLSHAARDEERRRDAEPQRS